MQKYENWHFFNGAEQFPLHAAASSNEAPNPPPSQVACNLQECWKEQQVRFACPYCRLACTLENQFGALLPASWQAHAPPAHTHPRCSAILLGRSGATVAAKHNLQRELVCARTRHCAHHGREWARAKRSNGTRQSPIVGQRGKREGDGKEEAAPHAPENR